MTQEGYTHIKRAVALFERTESTVMPQRIMTVPQSGLFWEHNGCVDEAGRPIF